MKYPLLVVLLGVFACGAEWLLHKHDEAFVQTVDLPMQGTAGGEFHAKYDARYKVVVAFKKSDQLEKARASTIGGDAYESSAKLGQSLLQEIDLKIDGAENIEKAFSIFGGAPGYVRTDLQWEPHASYQLATFDAIEGKRYKLALSQNKSGSPTPAYIMIRMIEPPTSSAGLLVIVFGAVIFLTSFLFKSLQLGIRHLSNRIGHTQR